MASAACTVMEKGGLEPVQTRLPLKFILKLSHYSPGCSIPVQANGCCHASGELVRKQIFDAGSYGRVVWPAPIAVDFGQQIKLASVYRNGCGPIVNESAFLVAGYLF